MKTVYDMILATQDPHEVAMLRLFAANEGEITHVPVGDLDETIADYNELVDQYNDVFDAYVEERYQATSARYVLNFVLFLGAVISAWMITHV